MAWAFCATVGFLGLGNGGGLPWSIWVSFAGSTAAGVETAAAARPARRRVAIVQRAGVQRYWFSGAEVPGCRVQRFVF